MTERGVKLLMRNRMDLRRRRKGGDAKGKEMEWSCLNG
jgi:hypothetical protein